jgi:ABC-type phosphate/phosphonate transport system ATPase subunit
MTDNERHERYAAAISGDSENPYGTANYLRAKAAMAVADEELAHLRDEWHATVMDRLKHINRLKDENARLRAELADYRRAIDVQYPEGNEAR